MTMTKFGKLLSISLFLGVFSCLTLPNAFAGPKWSFEASGGIYQPEDDNWSDYYGSDRIYEISLSFARRIFSVLDIGATLNYGLDRGTGTLPISGLQAGTVTYHMVPIDVYAVLRLRFTEGQWIVPYVGGGYTRFNYQQTVKDQGSKRGAVNGQHLRAGLQILLDPLERGAAKMIYDDFGVINSYLILEGQQTTATVDGTPDVELGGISYRAGFLLEFN